MADGTEDVVAGVHDALRRWYASFGELGRQFGLHLQMHGSDAAALLEITNAETRDQLLTQTELARRIGLSTNATSTLLNRLEDAGHVARIRSRSDRRVVQLRATPTVHDEVERFFEGVGRDLDRIMLDRRREELESFTRLLASMTAELDRHLVSAVRRRSDDPSGT